VSGRENGVFLEPRLDLCRGSQTLRRSMYKYVAHNNLEFECKKREN